MSGTRIILLAAVLAVGVAIVDQGLVRLVDASGARDQPAVVLILLLSAFLGLLTAVLARAMNLPSAIAPTSLVLGWIIVPPVLAAIPSQATEFFATTPNLGATEATSLAVAVVAAAVTLAVSGR